VSVEILDKFFNESFFYKFKKMLKGKNTET